MGQKQSAPTDGGSNQIPPSHIRIWQNVCAIESASTRAEMLETLLQSPEYIQTAKRMGTYAFCLQWLASYRRGEVHPWPYTASPIRQQVAASPGYQQQQQQQQQHQIIAHPAPKKAHDYFTECCELLGIREDQALTSEVIRAAYKRAAVRAHPDRGGNPELFDAVTRASAYLQNIVDRVAGIRQQNERMSAPVPQTREQLDAFSNQRQAAVAAIHDKPGVFQSFRNTRAGEASLDDAQPPVALSPQKLDMNLFNQLFEENKLPDPERDDGYGDWLKATGQDDSVRENPSLKKKFALDTFNKAFESEARGGTGGQNRAAYGPSALILTPTSGVVLGADKPPDYTAPYGGKGVQYTDLKSAYTSDSTFSQNVADAVDSLGSRPRDIKEMERARAAPVSATSEEARRIKEWEAQQKRAEEDRIRRMAQHDEAAARYHERIQGRLRIA